MCGSPNVAFKYTATAGDWYDCGDCGWFFYIESSSGAGSDYISVPFSGEGEGEIKFVSTRRCVVTLNGVKEYFSFRVEDGKGALEITLGNGETFTASFPATTLSGIVNNGVFPIQKNLDN